MNTKDLEQKRYEDSLLRQRIDEATEVNAFKAFGETAQGKPQLTCERCGNKTDAGAWIGFVYVGAECLTKDDEQYTELAF